MNQSQSLGDLRAALQSAHRNRRADRESALAKPAAKAWDEALATAARRIGMSVPGTRHGIAGAERKKTAHRLRKIEREILGQKSMSGHIHVPEHGTVRFLLETAQPRLHAAFEAGAQPGVPALAQIRALAAKLTEARAPDTLQLAAAFAGRPKSRRTRIRHLAKDPGLALRDENGSGTASRDARLAHITLSLTCARIMPEKLGGMIQDAAKTLGITLRRCLKHPPTAGPFADPALFTKPGARPEPQDKGFEAGEPVSWEAADATPDWNLPRGVAIHQAGDGSWIVLTAKRVFPEGMKRLEGGAHPCDAERMAEFEELLKKHPAAASGAAALALAALGHPGHWKTAARVLGEKSA